MATVSDLINASRLNLFYKGLKTKFAAKDDVDYLLSEVNQYQIVEEVTMVSPDELPDFFAYLGRYLYKDWNLQVSGGTLDTTLTLEHFFGPGRIRFMAASENNLPIFAGGVFALRSHIQITFTNIIIKSSTLNGGYALKSEDSGYIAITGSNSKITSDDQTGVGILANCGSVIDMKDGTISNLNRLCIVQHCGTLALQDVTLEDLNNGIQCWGSGTVFISGSTNETVATTGALISGGMIVNSSGQPLTQG